MPAGWCASAPTSTSTVDFWALSDKGKRVCDVAFDAAQKPVVCEKVASGACLALVR